MRPDVAVRVRCGVVTCEEYASIQLAPGDRQHGALTRCFEDPKAAEGQDTHGGLATRIRWGMAPCTITLMVDVSSV